MLHGEKCYWNKESGFRKTLSAGDVGGLVFCIGWSAKITFEQKREKNEPFVYLEKSPPGGTCWSCSGNSREARVAGVRWAREKVKTEIELGNQTI